MHKQYVFETSKGDFYIAELEGRFHVLYRDESLGSYHSPRAAIDDLAHGHTFSPRGGFDTGTLGISDNINDWQRLPVSRG